jgi:hypothetical protein
MTLVISSSVLPGKTVGVDSSSSSGRSQMCRQGRGAPPKSTLRNSHQARRGATSRGRGAGGQVGEGPLTPAFIPAPNCPREVVIR